jgi:hypothetical protein
MKKRILLISGIVVLIIVVYGVYTMFFSNVGFEYVYDGTVTFSDTTSEHYKEYIKKKAYIFNSKEEWEDFKENLGLSSSGQITDISFDNEPILFVHNPLSIENGETLYSIENIRKNLFNLKIRLKQKGTVLSIKGFEENSVPENIMIYKIKLGAFGEIYEPYLEIE